MHSFFLKIIEHFVPSKKIYIVPTLDGIKLLILNIILLIIGLAYGNNFILLFNFILFGLFLCSMFYTNFNLERLEVEGIKYNPGHVGDICSMQLFFKSTSKLDHHFIKIKIKSDLIELQNNTFSFLHSFNNQIQIDCNALALKRGAETITKVYLETLFPFHLFRSFTVHSCHFEILNYPKLNTTKLFQEFKNPSDQNDDIDDFSLKDYVPGDPLTRVDWKKVAQKNQWLSKTYSAPKLTPVTLSLTKDESGNLEEKLSSIATYIYQYHNNGTHYGVSFEHLNNKAEIILPNNSIFHLQRCLKQLAIYEY